MITSRKVSQFKVGDRVQTAAWTDRFMQGDRYGTVERVLKSGLVRVLLDRSQHSRRFHPANIESL